MATWQTGDTNVHGISFHYTRTGGDKPPLLMAHGHSDNGLCWTRVAKALEDEYDLIMYDARGHGVSGDGDTPRTREDMAHDAARLIAALDLGRPGMIGHSMGAFTAAYAAALYPDALSYIILEDPPWFDPEARAERDRIRQRREEEPPPETREGWLALYRERYADPHVDDMTTWADAQMQFRRHRQDPRSPDRPWQEIAAQITCPTLLITGDPELGSIVTPRVAEEALRLIPKAEVAHIAGAGHTIRRTQFDAYLAAVRAFLARR